MCVAVLSVMVCGPQLKADERAAKDESKSGQHPNSSKPQAGKPTSAKSNSAKSVILSLTPVEEDAALAFAKQHHSELATLLEQLRSKSTSGFSRGIREIHQAAQRLERFRDKQPARFEAELKNWQLDSEIRLLTAKWTMSQDPKLVDSIQALLRTRQVARIDRLKTERDRLAERLQHLDNQIGMGTEELEADLAAEWQQLAKRSATTAKAHKNRTKLLENETRTGNAVRVKPSKSNKTASPELPASKDKAKPD